MEKKYGKKKTFVLALALSLFALAVSSVGIVAAKYIWERRQTARIQASEFHFSSDYLEENEASFTVSDWFENGISVELYNYEKLNTALISETAIEYTVSVSDPNWTFTATDEAGKELDRTEKGGYIFPQSAEKSVQILKFSYTGTESAPEAVTVTVTSVAPYSFTMQGAFTLKKRIASPTYTIEEVGDAVYVTVNTNAYAGNVKVAWNKEKVSPYNANPAPDMSGWEDTAGCGVFTGDANRSYTLIFIKNTTDAAEREWFTVSKE